MADPSLTVPQKVVQNVFSMSRSEEPYTEAEASHGARVQTCPCPMEAPQRTGLAIPAQFRIALYDWIHTVSNQALRLTGTQL